MIASRVPRHRHWHERYALRRVRIYPDNFGLPVGRDKVRIFGIEIHTEIDVDILCEVPGVVGQEDFQRDQGVGGGIEVGANLGFLGCRTIPGNAAALEAVVGTAASSDPCDV